MASYGKDPALHARNVAHFSASQKAFANRPAANRRGKGGGGVRFRDRYRPSVEFQDRIRLQFTACKVVFAASQSELQEVNDLGFFPFVSHFDGRLKKDVICSAGPFHEDRNRREPCWGCECFWDGIGKMRAQRDAGAANARKRYSKSERFVFNVIDYDTYYESPSIDSSTGNVRMRPADGANPPTPYTEWQKGLKHPELARAGYPSSAGRMCHWEMGPSHYQVIQAAMASIATGCRSCGSKADRKDPTGLATAISTVAYICENPACGDALIDLKDTVLTPQEISEAIAGEMRCHTCGHVGAALEMLACANCTNPVRASIYDVDLIVQAVPSANNSDDMKGTTLQIVAWSDPYPLPAQFTPLLEKAHDLPKLYAPTPYEQQKSIFTDITLSSPQNLPGQGGGQVAGRPFSRPAY